MVSPDTMVSVTCQDVLPRAVRCVVAMTFATKPPGDATPHAPDRSPAPMSPDHIVLILDDDRGIRDSLTTLLSSYDMHTVAFESAAAYLAYPPPDVPACLILDVELPDINGLELQ